MGRYQILLEPDLEKAYEEIARQLNIPVDQVLIEALGLFASRLLLENYPGITDESRLMPLCEWLEVY